VHAHTQDSSFTKLSTPGMSLYTSEKLCACAHTQDSSFTKLSTPGMVSRVDGL
jgi:hypothetical protein